MNCKDCSYKEFHDGNGRRYYCLHDDARYARNKCEPRLNVARWVQTWYDVAID